MTSRETVRIVQIDQPLCSRRYGDAFQSPTGGCQAVLGVSGQRKCFNTRFTCQDPANYSPGILTLSFSEGQAELSKHYDNVIPSIETLDTTPGEINFGGMDRASSPLGQREVVQIRFKDHQHSDHRVDPYRLERMSGAASAGSPSETYDPYTRGTFWGKWIARNPFHYGYALRVYEGEFGEALEDMRVRHYIIDKVEGPADGKMRMTAKDFFAHLEREKAVAPKPSQGELFASITASDSSFTLNPNGIGDTYPTAGLVVIGDEIIQYTRNPGSELCTVVLRGVGATTAAAHDEEDLVQVVLQFTTRSAVDIVFELLCNYTALGTGGSPTESQYIDKAEWNAAASSLDELYTASIATPTPVEDLLAELTEQAGFSIWPDVEEGMIKFRAIRAAASIATLDDNAIVKESFKRTEQIQERVSQVWVYYGQINPVEDLDEKRNYHSRFVNVDLDAESDEEYGAPAIKEFFSRWIPQFGRGLAEEVSDRHLAMFRDPPYEYKFRLHISHGNEVELAGYTTLATAEVQDETGLELETQLTTIAIERDQDEIEVTARTVTFPDVEAADERVIFIENDANNLNLRTIHDTLFVAPVGGSPNERVRFVIDPGVVIGSTSTSNPAITTGSWPAGVVLTLEVNGRIQGMGGGGGGGGSNTSETSTPTAGSNGQTGGTALMILAPISLNNSNGQIWGGGGGGGGGGAARISQLNPDDIVCEGGGGGGGGAGTNGGGGGGAGLGNQSGIGEGQNGSVGSSGTDTVGGGAGAGGNHPDPFGTAGGAGGAGGGPGLSGANGSSGSPGTPNGEVVFHNDAGAGGSGGAAGKYIDGIAFVTWAGSPNGDVRGNVS